MNNFIKLTHALIVWWKDELVHVYLFIMILYFSFLFLSYALAISSSSIWLSRCNLIFLACTSLRSIWWTFKYTPTFTNNITIKYTWNSCTISDLLSSFNWYTWYAVYSSSNRFLFFSIHIYIINKWWLISFRSCNIFG
jgi:hypothetical protein